jgi:TonB-linked SusC/RagA family outer membrane protein
MKNYKTICLKLLLLWSISSIFLLTGTAVFAQTKVSGTVTNKQNAPIVGATVRVINKTARYTTTNEVGQFSIVAAKGDVIEITYVGYVKKEVKVTSGNLTIELEETVSQLDNVVVIGYGKVKRKDVTGSITSISGDELRKTQPVTFDQALQGKVAGVMVQQVSGQPGGGVSIQVRGVSSITGNNSPLYVIDGVIIPAPSDPGNGSNPLNTINPSEIESIDVLKDASATAIYGSQATNGVIVITTKRGKQGAVPQISYDGYYGWQSLPKKLPTVNLQQFATLLNDRATNGYGWSWDLRPSLANPKYLGTGTDWQGALFRNAPMTNHTLTLSGSSNDGRTQYLLSGTYFDQEGIALGSDFKRYSVRTNLDNKTTDWLKIGISLQLAHVDENVNATASNVIATALSMTPDIPVKNPDGTWGGITDSRNGLLPPITNPVGMSLLVQDEKYRNQVFGNVYAEIQFTKELMLRNEVSGNFDFNTEEKFTPTYQFGVYGNATNSSSYSYGQNFYTVVRNFLTYSHLFKNEYNLNAMVGHEAQLNTYSNVSATRTNFPSNNVTSIGSGDATTATNDGSKGSGPALEAYFGRVNLTLLDKYLITGNLRRDGSSNFPSDGRWVTTYSGAFAWRINKEKFLENVKSINELKLRIGYGLTNNQGIPGNTFVTLLSSRANGLAGTAQFQSNLSNPYVKWEKTNYYNAGIDGTLFNQRIDFSIDVYKRLTDGLLLALPLAAYSGTSTNAGGTPGAMNAPYVNVGSVQNTGFDFRISSTNISTKNFTWRTDITVSHNVNKVRSLGPGGDLASLTQTLNNEVFEKTVVGKPIGEFYGYKFDGVFATANDFKTHALPVDQSGNPYPVSQASPGIWYGDRKFKDLNGDGVIDSKDQTYLGSPLPKVQLGLGNNFTYKNFDLSIFFTANIGNKVLNELAISQNNPQNNTSYFTSVLNYAKLALINPSGSASDVNNVYVTNPNTSIIGLRNDNTNDNQRPSDLFIENGSFLRCKNITLGYKFSESMMSKMHMHSLRLYMNITNAFMITGYSGMDPEIGSWNPLQAGWDNGYYPQSRVFTIGANLNLTK